MRLKFYIGLVFLISGISINSCSKESLFQNSAKIVFNEFHFSNDSLIVDINSELNSKLEKVKRGNLESFNYYYPSGNENILLYFKSDSIISGKFIDSDKDTSLIIFLGQKVLFARQETHEILKFSINLEKIDGNSVIFFSRELGILIKYNPSWRKGIVLMSIGDKQDIIKELTDHILKDKHFLLRAGIPPPPAPPF